MAEHDHVISSTASVHHEARPNVLVITGATATGKTALSIEVARALQGEIVSLDSRQVYRGMDIGTAKPSAAERRAIPHHGLDIVSPAQRYSAGRFARNARCWIQAIQARGHVPILVGGTGFFLRALTHPLFEEPELPARRRLALSRLFGGKPDSELLRWLSELDPQHAAQLARSGGRQRILRSLEMVLLTGHRLSWWQRHAASETPPLRPLIFVLELPREELYRRINQRVLDMIAAGLVEEVRSLRQAGFDQHSPGLQATGYIELLPYLRGELDLPAAVDAIQRATRRYARRQLTWFRNQLPAHRILDAGLARASLVDQIVRDWQSEVNSANRY